MDNPSKYFVGIDLHKTILQVCVLDSDGNILEERRFRGGSLEEGVATVEWLAQWKDGGRFCVEALGLNRWFVLSCIDFGLDIVVVDATKMGLRMLGKKTDRRDAYELARRLRLGDIDRNAATYFANEREFAGRKLVRTRHTMTQLRQEARRHNSAKGPVSLVALTKHVVTEHDRVVRLASPVQDERRGAHTAEVTGIESAKSKSRTTAASSFLIVSATQITLAEMARRITDLLVQAVLKRCGYNP